MFTSWPQESGGASADRKIYRKLNYLIKKVNPGKLLCAAMFVGADYFSLSMECTVLLLKHGMEKIGRIIKILNRKGKDLFLSYNRSPRNETLCFTSG